MHLFANWRKSHIAEDDNYEKYLYQYLRSRKMHLTHGMITNTFMYSGFHNYGLSNFVVWWIALMFRRKHDTSLQGKHGGSITVFQLRSFLVKFKRLTFPLSQFIFLVILTYEYKLIISPLV